MPQTALNYLSVFRNDTQNKIASPIQNGKNKFIHFYVVLSFKPEALCIIFFIIVKRFFQIFLFLVRWDVQVKIFWLMGAQLWLLETRAWHTIAQPSGAGLKRITLMVCRKIMPSYLKSLYGSMLRVMKAVVDAQGGHTMYWRCLLHVFVLSIE